MPTVTRRLALVSTSFESPRGGAAVPPETSEIREGIWAATDETGDVARSCGPKVLAVSRKYRTDHGASCVYGGCVGNGTHGRSDGEELKAQGSPGMLASLAVGIPKRVLLKRVRGGGAGGDRKVPTHKPQQPVPIPVRCTCTSVPHLLL